MIKDYIFRTKKEVLFFLVSVWELPGKDKDVDVNVDYFPTYLDAVAYRDGLQRDFGEHIKEMKIFRAKEQI